MKPIEHINQAIKELDERGMRYTNVWDSLIACRDDLIEEGAKNTEQQVQADSDLLVYEAQMPQKG